MKKILFLIPVLCFAACIAAVIRIGPAEPTVSQPAASSVPTVPATAAPTEPEATEPPPGPQRTAFPIRPEDPDFYSELFFSVEDAQGPNHELQHYLPEQARIEGSRMSFTADLDGDQYISGRMESMVGFRYGTVTVRVQTVDTPGFFPAVWMLPAGPSRLPEIDIYESLGREPEVIYGVYHFLSPETGEKDRLFFRHTHEDPANLPEFSTIRFEWTPESLTWYLNGEQLYSVTEHVPQEPMYLIVNLAVGGDFCLDPEPDTPMPVTFTAEILEFAPQEIYTR